MPWGKANKGTGRGSMAKYGSSGKLQLRHSAPTFLSPPDYNNLSWASPSLWAHLVPQTPCCTNKLVCHRADGTGHLSPSVTVSKKIIPLPPLACFPGSSGRCSLQTGNLLDVWNQTSLLPWWSGWRNSCLESDKQKESAEQTMSDWTEQKKKRG